MHPACAPGHCSLEASLGDWRSSRNNQSQSPFTPSLQTALLACHLWTSQYKHLRFLLLCLTSLKNCLPTNCAKAPMQAKGTHAPSKHNRMTPAAKQMCTICRMLPACLATAQLVWMLRWVTAAPAGNVYHGCASNKKQNTNFPLSALDKPTAKVAPHPSTLLVALFQCFSAQTTNQQA